MANVRIATATRNAMLNALRDAIDAGATGGTIKVYTGSQPANANVAVGGQTLLGTLTFSGTSASNAAAGVLTFDAITEDSSADASGDATWARIADSDGNTIFDCDVGEAADSATITLNEKTIAAGGPIRMTSGTLTMPAS